MGGHSLNLLEVKIITDIFLSSSNEAAPHPNEAHPHLSASFALNFAQFHMFLVLALC